MQRLCASLDDMHEQVERICHEITAEARKASDAAPKAGRPRRRKKKR
jgi:hypothetical protein